MSIFDKIKKGAESTASSIGNKKETFGAKRRFTSCN